MIVIDDVDDSVYPDTTGGEAYDLTSFKPSWPLKISPEHWVENVRFAIEKADVMRASFIGAIAIKNNDCEDCLNELCGLYPYFSRKDIAEVYNYFNHYTIDPKRNTLWALKASASVNGDIKEHLANIRTMQRPLK